MSVGEVQAPIAQAIAVDEVGLSFGILGAFRLKTVYQPIFAHYGETLVPVAMSAAVRIERGGRPAPDDVLSTFTADKRALLPRIGRRLAIRNLDHIGCDDPRFGLMLGLSGDVGMLRAETGELVSEAAAAGIANDRICFDLSGSAGSGLGALMASLKGVGASWALDIETAGRPDRVPDATPVPPLVRVPPAWTRRIVGEADLLRVFRLLVTTLKQRGAAVQIEGIADASQLRAALATGAERLAGDYLAVPALAGTDFDDAPRALAKLIGVRGKVVPLSA